MSTIAIIPARGGSKRIKNKNIVDFCGKPIIYYALQAAKESGLFDNIHVSTESADIRDVVEGLGFSVDFLRDPSLADDHTPLMPVLRWVLEQYRGKGARFDDVCLLMPCAPLVEARDLVEAYEVYKEQGRARPLLAVAPYPAPIEWSFELELPSHRLKPSQPGKSQIRSQDLGKKYYDTGTFVFYNASYILDPTRPTDQDYIGYILAKEKAVDIDDMEDLALAKALFLARHP